MHKKEKKKQEKKKRKNLRKRFFPLSVNFEMTKFKGKFMIETAIVLSLQANSFRQAAVESHG